LANLSGQEQIFSISRAVPNVACTSATTGHKRMPASPPSLPTDIETVVRHALAEDIGPGHHP